MTKKVVSKLLGSEDIKTMDLLMQIKLGCLNKDEYNSYIKPNTNYAWEDIPQRVWKSQYEVEGGYNNNVRMILSKAELNDFKYGVKYEVPKMKIVSEDGYFSGLNSLNMYLEDAGGKGMICGGAIRDVFLNKQPRDMDMYFKTVEDFEDAVKKLLNNSDYFISYTRGDMVGKFTGVCGFQHKKTGKTLELIGFNNGEAKKIISKFDFTISMFAYEKTEESYKITYVDRYMYDLAINSVVLNDEFKQNNKPTAMRTLYGRMLKYKGYGFNISPELQMEVATYIRESNDSIFDIICAEGAYAMFSEGEELVKV